MLRLPSAFLCLSLATVGFSGRARAVDQATLDNLVAVAKQACLVGTKYDLHADAKGNVAIKSLLRPGAEIGINVSKREGTGAANYFDESIRLIADRQIQECLRPYTIRIFEAILGTKISLSPGTPSRELLQAPEAAEVIDKFTAPFVSGSVGLYSCSNRRKSIEGQSIACFIILMREQEGHSDHDIDEIASWKPKLFDNLRIEHIPDQIYFLNGRGEQQPAVNLSKGERAWLVIEFAGGANDISSARIAFTAFGSYAQLSGPVKLPEQ
jgi:hypothetical protein